MDCKTFKEQVWQYHEEALGQPEMEACEAHLVNCRDCRNIAAGVAHFHEYVEAARQAEPGPFAATRIVAAMESALERSKKQPSFLSLPGLKPVLISFALLTGVILGITGATSRLRQSGIISTQDANIQTMRSDLFITDLLDEDRILTLTPQK